MDGEVRKVIVQVTFFGIFKVIKVIKVVEGSLRGTRRLCRGRSWRREERLATAS